MAAPPRVRAPADRLGLRWGRTLADGHPSHFFWASPTAAEPRPNHSFRDNDKLRDYLGMASGDAPAASSPGDPRGLEGGNQMASPEMRTFVEDAAAFVSSH
ncbi:hypothetical protein DL764_001417 [Monosporascus ibericus]|uniref:Uncharacterized protein n=1 Tax=Monosporascus ibericus TaxID=155417 RepID=A0A4Q4TPM0_9PEZI|nr:hypothetical protein DL764_001417 [Monosporascus ibericus]